MKPEFSTAITLFWATVSAFPTSIDYCGPASNCVLSNTTSGTLAYRHLPGHEPGTESHRRRFYHSKREDTKYQLMVVMGEQRMDWGCDTDVEKVVRDALDQHCPDNAGCDKAGENSIKVHKWQGDDNMPEEATLKISMDGKYFEKEERDFLAKALLATISDKSVEAKEQEWHRQSSGQSEHSGMTSSQGKCDAKNFPQYVAVNRFAINNGQRGDIQDWIEFEAKLVEPKVNCLGVNIIGAIIGAINPLAGKMFTAPAKVICQAALKRKD